MKYLVLLLSLLTGLGNTQDDSLINQTFIKQIEAILPAVEGYQRFTSNVVTFLSQMDQTKPHKDREIKAFIDQIKSIKLLPEVQIGVIDDKSYAVYLIDNYLFSSLYLTIIATELKDLLWAVKDEKLDVTHPNVQNAIGSMLTQLSRVNQGNLNDTIRCYNQAIYDLRGNNTSPDFTARLMRAATQLSQDQPRAEGYLLLTNLMISFEIDPSKYVYLQEQLDLGYLLSDIERFFTPFWQNVPDNFQSHITIWENPDNGNYSTSFAKIIKFVSDHTRRIHELNPFVQQSRGPARNPEIARLRQKIDQKNARKTIGEFVPTASEISAFLNSFPSIKTTIYLSPEEENLPKKKRNAAFLRNRNAHQAKLSNKIRTDSVPAAADELVQEPVQEIPTPPNETPTAKIEESWDYHTWAAQQPFTTRVKTSAPETPTRVSIPDLTGKGLAFYKALFGQGGKNVKIDAFADFLTQIGGTKVKMSPTGMKVLLNSDLSVICMAAIPNLREPGAFSFIRCHQPHNGSTPFPRRTLYNFLRPQLEAAGYASSN